MATIAGWPDADLFSAWHDRQMSEATVRRHVLVSGRVQGVWFREGCRREAQLRAVTGWVSNRADGRVEAVFEGSPESVEALVGWCRSGPPQAHVVTLEVSTEQPQGEAGFAVF
jgi:acylphosphatase